MKLRYILNATIVLSVFCISSFAQKVDTDWDHSADFSRYKTYAWLDNRGPVKDQLWNQRITQGIDSQMAAKGFRKVSTESNPDVSLIYHAGVKQSVSVVGYNYGFGPGWRWGGGNGHDSI